MLLKVIKTRIFLLPDEKAELEPFKLADFNDDQKEDILIELGACGTGGCMYGLFLNQFDNYYTLAYMDYLKNPEFEKEKKGFLMIKSYEEVSPYDPSNLSISIYRFDEITALYELDPTFVEG